MVIVFMMGMYVPTVLVVSNLGGGANSGGTSSSLVSEDRRPGGDSQASSSSLLRTDVNGLRSQLVEAKSLTKALEEENRRLRSSHDKIELDSQIILSNLQTLKSKRKDEIKQLEAKIAELEASNNVNGAQGSPCAQELEMVRQQKRALELEKMRLVDDIKALQLSVKKVESGIKDGDSQQDPPQIPGVVIKRSEKGPVVPPPPPLEPLQGHWAEKIKELFDLVSSLFNRNIDV